MSTPAPQEENSITGDSKLATIITTTVATAALFVILFGAWLHNMQSDCSEFWNGEKCVITAVPDSIKESFSKEYYDAHRNGEQP